MRRVANNVYKLIVGTCLFSDSIVSLERSHSKQADSTKGQCEPACDWAVVDKLSVKIRGYNFTRGDKVLLCDPTDPKKQIVRYIRCSSNEWIRVSDRGGSKFIFVPRGFCALDIGSGSETPIDCHSLEVVPLGLVKGFVVCSLQ